MALLYPSEIKDFPFWSVTFDVKSLVIAYIDLYKILGNVEF